MDENSELFFLDILNGKVLIATVTDLIIFMLLQRKMCEELNLKKGFFPSTIEWDKSALLKNMPFEKSFLRTILSILYCYWKK